jgi:prevent-host-death family protein
MLTVGIRELKTNLSRYLSKVKSGEKIIITDRKQQVAIITPIGRESDEEKALKLAARGIAYWSGGKPAGLPVRMVSRGKTVSEAILQDRR